MRRLLRATPLVVERRRSWWGEQYVGIDLHRRRSVIVPMTGAGEVLETIRERKAEMDAHADAFVALPGGFGTLEELLEVITLRQLRLHRRPVVLVNVAGYYDPFLAMVRSMVAQGFAPAGRARCSRSRPPRPKRSTWPSWAPARWRPAREPPVEALAEDWTDASTGS